MNVVFYFCNSSLHVVDSQSNSMCVTVASLSGCSCPFSQWDLANLPTFATTFLCKTRLPQSLSKKCELRSMPAIGMAALSDFVEIWGEIGSIFVVADGVWNLAEPSVLTPTLGVEGVRLVLSTIGWVASWTCLIADSINIALTVWGGKFLLMNGLCW